MRRSVQALFAALLLGAAPVAAPLPAQAAASLTDAYNGQTDTAFRQGMQIRLAWTGDYAGAFDGDIDAATLRAIRDFQARHGMEASGVVDERMLRLLVVESDRAQHGVGFSYVDDADTGARIGLPLTLVRDLGPTEIGHLWRSPDNSIEIETARFADGSRSLSALYEMMQTPGANRSVSRSEFGGNWFEVAGKDGERSFFIRFQARGSDLRGFSASYDPSEAPSMDRTVAVASRLFDGFAAEPKAAVPPQVMAENRADLPWAGAARRNAAPVTGAAYAERGAALLSKGGSAQASALPGSSRDQGAAPSFDSSGTGFVVSEDGWLLTNAHVARSCKTLLVGDHHVVDQRILDGDNDLALLHVKDGALGKPLPLSKTAPRLGEDILALGFPLRSILADSLNVTRGNVSSLMGLMNDPRYLQISAPVQPGNSGGPLVDLSGRVVGVVTAKLNAVAVADATGDIPQAINFAIRPENATRFLDANGIHYVSADPAAKAESVPDATAAVQKSIEPVLCLGG